MKLVIIFVFLMLLFCAVKLNKIMNTQIALVDLHLEHKEWLNKLLFYKDDLNHRKKLCPSSFLCLNNVNTKNRNFKAVDQVKK